jgi:2-oxoglutarate dehydrogenase E2 component (dihydrolipoamide succinyltransferase)
MANEIIEIIVPAMGESIVEATIASWLKKPGDTVKAGEDLVELETEKVNQVLPAEFSGVLVAIAKNEGDTVKPGESLGTINKSGSTASSSSGSAPTVAATAVPTPEAPKVAATPTGEAIAQKNGVDITNLPATGPGGKVGKDDVLKAIETPAIPIPSPVAPTAPTTNTTSSLTPAPTNLGGSTGRPEERIKMSRRRQAIATNLKQAQNTAAMLTTFNEVDMSVVMELRKRRKEDFEKRFGIGLGFMSFFTKAVIGALKQFPSVNAEIQGNELVLKKYYDIGIAVGVEDGLVVPVVRDADKKSFAQIEKTIKELALKAKDNTLTLAEMQGGTFTITNGGIFGSMLSTPILNYPQVGILGMHNIVERPVVRNAEIVIRPIMYIALSYDHRIIDGGTAVRFLVKVKELIEDPESLLLEG